MRSTLTSSLLSVLAMAACTAGVTAQSWLPSSPYPAWGQSPPSQTTRMEYNQAQDSETNGARLHTALRALTAGQGLAIGPGTWSIRGFLDLKGAGTEAAPIWVYAADPQRKPVITRPDGNQNVINMGSAAPASYWVLQNLEITGGGDLLRLFDCDHIWIDQCNLHDGGGLGVVAQTIDTQFLYITRNEVARPGPGTNGEAMYLGANHGAVIMSYSVVAYNHVHDTRSAVFGQGDGIEVKQGSHHNWILGNHVHNCKNPCILVYGTGGNGENVVEGNLCYDSDDTVLQVQGEAIVRNNIAIGGGLGFDSHDHQGQVMNLTFVHNTIINRQRAALLNNWSGRPGMVFANNVIYSLEGEAIRFGNGATDVTMAGNVVLGSVINATTGFLRGTGLADFVDVDLTTFRTDATPVVGGALDNRGRTSFSVAKDMRGQTRVLPVDPGALTNAVTFAGDATEIRLATGGTQRLSFLGGPLLANASYLVVGNLTGTTPGGVIEGLQIPLNFDGWLVHSAANPNSGMLQNTSGVLSATGTTTARLVLPPLSSVLSGLVMNHVLVITQGDKVRAISNPVAVTLR